MDDPVRRAFRFAVGAVVTLAIALRFARLWWGLDEDLWFFDETMWSLRLQAFRQLRWRSFDTTGLGYPTLYQIVGGLGAWAIGLAGWTLQGATAVGWMRTLAATASVLAVLVTMRLGVAMYGRWAGIAAGALLAAAPLEVMQVHYASVEPFLVLATTLVMAASWWLVRRGTLAAAALAGVATGLAIGSKYPGLAFGSAVAWAIGERWWRERALGAAARRAAGAGLAMIASFALACPSCFLHADLLMGFLDRHRMMAAFAAFQGACMVPDAGWWHRPWLYEIVASLPYGMGLPFALLGYAGIGVAVGHRTLADRMVLATLVPYFAYMGASDVVYPRYMLPLFPGLALLAAAALVRAVPPRAAAAVLAVVVAYGVALDVSQLRRFSWDQQAAVAEWLGDRAPLLAPEDRVVAVPAPEPPDPYYKLRRPIQAKGFRVATLGKAKLFDGRPAFFVMPHWLAMTVHRDRRDALLLHRLQQLEAGLAGYRPVLRVPIPPYLQRRFDEAWDPTFAIELWQGAIGFTVYARHDVLPDLQTAEELPPLPPRREAANPD
jgi:4-amino-4-deoxy-L-arabinose transferase-like glycosyltransferase